MDDRTYSQSLKDRAVARRATQANAQALETSQMQLAHAQPMADALHRMFSAYAAVLVRASDAAVGEYDAAFDAAFAAHRATTPSEVPSSHVIVERAHLDWLRRIADGLGELLMVDVFDECSPAVTHLRQIVDEVA
jgi:hypothetical protein